MRQYQIGGRILNPITEHAGTERLVADDGHTLTVFETVRVPSMMQNWIGARA